MTTSFNFSIATATETHNGSAVILDFSSDVKTKAEEAFKADGDDRAVTVRAIGQADGPDQPGYKAIYDVYECYTDSASDEYYYFAVINYSKQI